MNELVLVQLPRTARGTLAAAFDSVGVRVHLVDHAGAARQRQLPPTAVTAAVLRHPVDRLQSWYNSRLRAGRPFRPAMWTDWEAAFFTALPSFERFGEAVCSTDEFRRSAAERGLAIWEEQFGSLAEAYGDRPRDIHFAGSYDDLPSAVQRLATLVECQVPELPSDASVIDATPPSLPRERSELADFGLRTRLADEIARYQELVALTSE